ncbi:MAG: hypothetical protein GPJ54_17415 [Candidatus Heimdallarchaeota archaeon]|nr:hypothetical protein [Candidatus Heimdallarchaeota archaeon]
MQIDRKVMRVKLVFLGMLLIFGNGSTIGYPIINQVNMEYEFLLTENTYEYLTVFDNFWNNTGYNFSINLILGIYESIEITNINNDEIQGIVTYFTKSQVDANFYEGNQLKYEAGNIYLYLLNENFTQLAKIQIKNQGYEESEYLLEMEFRIERATQEISYLEQNTIKYLLPEIFSTGETYRSPIVPIDFQFQNRFELFRSDIPSQVGDNYEHDTLSGYSTYYDYYDTLVFTNDTLPSTHNYYQREIQYHDLSGVMLNSIVEGRTDDMTYSVTKSLTKGTLVNVDNGDPVIIAPEPSTVTNKTYPLQFEVFEPFPKRYTLYINDEEYYTKQVSRNDPSFELFLTLDKGNTTLTLEVEDDWGHTASATTWVFRDETVGQILTSFIIPILIIAIPVLIWRRKKK